MDKFLFIIISLCPIGLLGQIIIQCDLVSSGGELSANTIYQNFSAIGEPVVGNITNEKDSTEIGFIFKSTIPNSTTNKNRDFIPDFYVSLYPNPSSGRFTLESPEVALESIELYDLTGRSINAEIAMDRHEAEVKMDYRGLVIVQITTSKGQGFRKILLE